MKRCGLYPFLLALCLAVGVVSCVLPRRSTTILRYENYPDYIHTDSLDKEAFKSYLDTAAIDDWEGVWLLVGPGVHRYLMVERITINAHSTYYTHRLRLWEEEYVDPFVARPAGMVVGYMGQGLYENEMNLELFPGSLFKGEELNVVIELDSNRNHIEFRLPKSRYRGEIGMRRLYPIRSVEEKSYKVRYL